MLCSPLRGHRDHLLNLQLVPLSLMTELVPGLYTESKTSLLTVNVFVELLNDFIVEFQIPLLLFVM